MIEEKTNITLIVQVPSSHPGHLQSAKFSSQEVTQLAPCSAFTPKILPWKCYALENISSEHRLFWNPRNVVKAKPWPSLGTEWTLAWHLFPASFKAASFPFFLAYFMSNENCFWASAMQSCKVRVPDLGTTLPGSSGEKFPTFRVFPGSEFL